jgi:hypothetical protein
MLVEVRRSRSGPSEARGHEKVTGGRVGHQPHPRILSGLVLAAITAASMMIDARFAGHLSTAEAQQRVNLNVASIMLAEPAASTPLPIQIGPLDGTVKNSFIRIRGLPPSANLSEGHAISPGSWAVPLTGLSNLSVVLPVGLQGQWNVVVGLVTIDGTVLAESKMTLVIATARVVAPPVQQAPSSTSVASLGPSAPPMSSPDRERALSLYAKGQEQLERGNVHPARMFFQRAAESGLAESALALGGTYDPDELAKIRVLGLQPDIETARKWYEKAQELGSPEARDRLRRLGGR